MIPDTGWEPSNPEYHTLDGRWSSSMVKTFRESPALARQRFVDRSVARAAATESAVVGAAANCLLMQPAGFGVLEVDAGSRTSKAYKDAVWTWGGRRIVATRTEMARARSVAEAIRDPQTTAAQVARSMLLGDDGVSEWATRWSLDGLELKAMIDRVRQPSSLDGLAITEFKTDVDPSPEPFRRKAERFGYFEQLAFNRQALIETARAQGIDPGSVPCHFVVVRNKAPWEVAVYKAAAERVARAWATVVNDLARIKECVDGGAPWGHWWETLPDGTLPTLE